jgi:hypothetical protein
MGGEEDEEKEILFWKMKNEEGDVGEMLGRRLEEMSLEDGDGDGEAGDEMEDEEMEEDEMEEDEMEEDKMEEDEMEEEVVISLR